MGSVSQEENAGNVNNRGAGDLIQVSPTPSHGFEVGDMVWGKVKSHPWWPGHVYSEELATPSARRLKKDGLLLVAFFGDSSYGWFDPSELIPFDSNFAEKSVQTNSRTFVKALEEAIDEVKRRSALGLCCMCRNKQNFRKTDSQGFFVVDVVDYEPEGVYSIDTIAKAKESFQPRLALDFLKELALEPTDEHDDIDFMKNKAIVMSYRRAVYEEFDETYDQAFGGNIVRPLPGSIQVSSPAKKPSKAPLSGRQVFGDTVGKVKSPTKLSKPKAHAKKDKYLLKRGDEPKETKIHQIEKVKEPTSPPQPASIEDPLVATIQGSTMKDTYIIPESNNPDFQINTPISSLIHKSSNVKMFVTQDDIPSSGPQTVNWPEKVKVSKRPAGELGSDNSVLLEKKRKKESLKCNGTQKGGVYSKEKISANKPPIEDPHKNEVAVELSFGKPVSLEKKLKRKKESLVSDADNPQMEIPRVLADLHSFALDPFYTNNRKLFLKVRQVFLKFRSLVFQKSSNLVTGNEATNTLRKSLVAGGPPVKPQVRPPGRPDDPTKGGIKRDRHEEFSTKKKMKIIDLKSSTKRIDEDGERQVAVVKPRKSGQVVRQWAAEPTILKMEFPSGGSLPSINELKVKLGRYGTMDHDRTRIYWRTFTCQVVYKYKADAQAALKAVTRSSNLFGNTDVKYYTLKDVSDFEPPAKVSDHQPAVEDRAAVVAAGTPCIPVKLCLKKSDSEEGGSSGGQKASCVKYNLTADKSRNSKNFENGILPLPLPNSTGASSCTAQFSQPLPPPPPLAPPPPPQNSMNYSTPLAPPSLPPPRFMPLAPPPALVPVQPPPQLTRPADTLSPTNIDIAQQMVSLLTRCNDVVAHVTGVLGYVPYHPL